MQHIVLYHKHNIIFNNNFTYQYFHFTYNYIRYKNIKWNNKKQTNIKDLQFHKPKLEELNYGST